MDGIANHFSAKMHEIAGFTIYYFKICSGGYTPEAPQWEGVTQFLDLDTNFRLAR